MYFNDIIDIPKSKKIIIKTNKSGTYVNYQYDSVYVPEKKYAISKRTTIGKVLDDDNTKMYPNANYIKYFGEYKSEVNSEMKDNDRSACLKVGTYIVLNKIIKDYKLDPVFEEFFGKYAKLMLDFSIYSIITEDNVAEYYPDYAYNHPIKTDYMKIYSDSYLSEMFKSIDKEQFIKFINKWNSIRDKDEKIYISYDSTSKVCKAGDIDFVEEGHSKNDAIEPIINYSIAFDCENQEALFYENYPGSINDIIQIQTMIERAASFGYKNLNFILDRGYFSKKNIKLIEEYGYGFVIMVKGMKSFVTQIVDDVNGTFETNYSNYSDKYGVFGTTIHEKLFEDDEKERYIHIYHSDSLALKERTDFLNKIEMLKRNLSKNIGKSLDNTNVYNKYFSVILGEDNKLASFRVKTNEVDQELKRCGYFVIITSEKMTAVEAIKLYKGRDCSEKLFRADKSFLGNGVYRVASSESQETKVFIEFIALVLRNKMYRCLRDESSKVNRSECTVPEAIRELEKIELIKSNDKKYHLSYGVSKKQRSILKTFKIDMTAFNGYINDLEKRLFDIEGTRISG